MYDEFFGNIVYFTGRLMCGAKSFWRECCKNKQFKTACGYWQSTIFIPLERTRGCIVMLEGSVGEELFSHAKQKTCHILYIYENLVVQEKGNKVTNE